jgi:hypothetical protein
MKKLIIPIASVAALTAMAIAASAIMTPSVATPKPAPASKMVMPDMQAKTSDVEAAEKEDCCAKPAKVEVAVEKETCEDCDKTVKQKDCDDCDEHKDSVEASTL